MAPRRSAKCAIAIGRGPDTTREFNGCRISNRCSLHGARHQGVRWKACRAQSLRNNPARPRSDFREPDPDHLNSAYSRRRWWRVLLRGTTSRRRDRRAPSPDSDPVANLRPTASLESTPTQGCRGRREVPPFTRYSRVVRNSLPRARLYPACRPPKSRQRQRPRLRTRRPIQRPTRKGSTLTTRRSSRRRTTRSKRSDIPPASGAPCGRS